MRWLKNKKQILQRIEAPYSFTLYGGLVALTCLMHFVGHVGDITVIKSQYMKLL
jgi:hypothetical protein